MLTPRLETVLSKVSGKTAADIGTDHAYIPIELIKQGKIERAVACDINEGPLRIAEANVKQNKLADKIELRLANGISALSQGEVDSVIIAGMGGVLISEILASDEDKAHSYKELILQPMNSQSELRKYLSSHNFRIIEEDLAIEGFKVYNILVVSTGEPDEYTEFETHIPKCLEGNRYFEKLVEKKEREFTKILTGLKKAGEKRYDKDMIDYYEGLMKELERYKG